MSTFDVDRLKMEDILKMFKIENTLDTLTEGDIQKAKRMYLKYHPDKNVNKSITKQKDIAEKFEILTKSFDRLKTVYASLRRYRQSPEELLKERELDSMNIIDSIGVSNRLSKFKGKNVKGSAAEYQKMFTEEFQSTYKRDGLGYGDFLKNTAEADTAELSGLLDYNEFSGKNREDNMRRFNEKADEYWRTAETRRRETGKMNPADMVVSVYGGSSSTDPFDFQVGEYTGNHSWGGGCEMGSSLSVYEGERTDLSVVQLSSQAGLTFNNIEAAYTSSITGVQNFARPKTYTSVEDYTQQRNRDLYGVDHQKPIEYQLPEF